MCWPDHGEGKLSTEISGLGEATTSRASRAPTMMRTAGKHVTQGEVGNSRGKLCCRERSPGAILPAVKRARAYPPNPGLRDPAPRSASGNRMRDTGADDARRRNPRIEEHQRRHADRTGANGGEGHEHAQHRAHGDGQDGDRALIQIAHALCVERRSPVAGML